MSNPLKAVMEIGVSLSLFGLAGHVPFMDNLLFNAGNATPVVIALIQLGLITLASYFILRVIVDG